MSQGTFEIPAPPAHLACDLTVPEGASGLVVFAHGSGSSRLSSRNRQVATDLNEHGLATLLLDLLTPEEERDRANVFDIELLSARLVAATCWADAHPQTSGLPCGYFGASTGAAAALCAAATLGEEIGAVVSRGGRPDLAGEYLAQPQYSAGWRAVNGPAAAALVLLYQRGPSAPLRLAVSQRRPAITA